MVQKEINVYWLSLREDTIKRGFWDQGIMEYMVKDFTSHEVDTIPSGDFGIVILPARSHDKLIKEVNHEINKLKSVILILAGDEEAVFPVEEIDHPSIRIWVQNPKPGRHDKYTLLGCGYPPAIDQATHLWEKTMDWAFSGQITHERREQMYGQLMRIKRPGFLFATKGFTQGFPPAEYYKILSQAKIAPCPSGPVTVDTFRVYEALELGCIPIADNQTPAHDWDGFWPWLFGEDVPFTVIANWESLPGYIGELVKNYPVLNNRCQAFWLRYKNALIDKLLNQIHELTGMQYRNQITIIIPISPIPSHPNTDILEETIKTIRYHLPSSEIILTFDGVRPEQEERRADYEEHIRRVLWKCRFWGNVKPYIFDGHIHQIGMMRSIIDKITTSKLLYVEQDTPIVMDEPIEWEKLEGLIDDGTSNMIRLHFEGTVPKEHNHLMIGEPENGLLKTVQWSQRPHLASVAFYKRIISEQFSPQAKCFIEDLVHGKLIVDWTEYGVQGWNQWRVHIYHPNNTNIKRSYNLDGRQGSQKYDDTQTW